MARETRGGATMKYMLSVLAALLLSACILAEAAEQKNTYKAAVGSDGVQKVEVTAGDYFFNPDRIVVKVNVPVEIRIRKEPGIVPHDFVLKAPEAWIDILESLSSDPKTIRFTPAKPGEYPFYCDKKLIFSKSHREKGMEGILEVIE
jgi:plastocyanin domain-containing protein